MVVGANGPVDLRRHPAGTPLPSAHSRTGPTRCAAQLATQPIRPAPTIWCSWYHYFTDVTAADIDENIRAIDDADLPLDVIQIDDGYQAEIGDWLTLSDRFADLRALADQIKGTGRRAGIWVAPFLAGERSRVAATIPTGCCATATSPSVLAETGTRRSSGSTSPTPGPASIWTRVFGTLSDVGFDFFKLDFLYAGALGRRPAGTTSRPLPPIGQVWS